MPLQHYQVTLTNILVKPADLAVHKWIVEDQSAEDEHGAVEVLHFWLVNDGSQDQVARYEHQQDCKHYGYLHTRQSQTYQITMVTMRLMELVGCYHSRLLSFFTCCSLHCPLCLGPMSIASPPHSKLGNKGCC